MTIVMQDRKEYDFFTMCECGGTLYWNDGCKDHMPEVRCDNSRCKKKHIMRWLFDNDTNDDFWWPVEIK